MSTLFVPSQTQTGCSSGEVSSEEQGSEGHHKEVRAEASTVKRGEKGQVRGEFKEAGKEGIFAVRCLS